MWGKILLKKHFFAGRNTEAVFANKSCFRSGKEIFCVEKQWMFVENSWRMKQMLDYLNNDILHNPCSNTHDPKIH